MKDIKTYINESKVFVLNDHERNSLAELTGILCGSFGDDNDKKYYQNVISKLSEKDIEQLSNLYDCLSDNETYKKINRNIIIDDISLIKKIYKLIDDNDLLDEQWDLIDAFEKIVL